MSPVADDPELTERFHRWYYDSEIWMRTSFLGVQCAKSVLDLWNYQEIITELRPSLVIEFGTFRGGSTLFFSTILRLVSPRSRVVTVDPNQAQLDLRVAAMPEIERLRLSSADPRVAARILALRCELPGPAFAILDSDHRIEHVTAELRLLRGVLRTGDYLVVEDTNINGHPVLPGWGDGPMEALAAYERDFPDDYDHDAVRERKFGFTFAPRGFLIRR